ILYALICGVTFVGFAGRAEFHSVKHAVIPFLGLVGNVGMLLAILIIGLTTGGVSTPPTTIALLLTAGWGLGSAGYLSSHSRKQGKTLIGTIPSAAGGD